MAGDHGCRICGKTFPSGRSLGGHMRSHVMSANYAAATDRLIGSAPAPGAGYVLRENRRKTWRLSETAAEGEALCQVCGKGFPSMQSMYGHLRCHSGFQTLHREEEDDHDDAFEEHSENEEAAAELPRRRRTRRVAAIPDEREEQKALEEGACGLMLLASDHAGASSWASSVAESSSVKVAESDLNSDDQYNAMEVQLEVQMEVGMKDGSEVYDSDIEMITNPSKKLKLSEDDVEFANARYHCSTCKKGFLTYQALGGHRASHHKKMKNCSEGSMEIESGDQIKVDVKKVKAHECPICHRMFVSGQALGGHKRSHMIQHHHQLQQQQIQQHQQQQEAEGHEMIDLNLPAPEASGITSDENMEYKWWMGHSQKFLGVNSIFN